MSTKAPQQGLSMAVPSDTTEMEQLALDWGQDLSPALAAEAEISAGALAKTGGTTDTSGKKVQL